MGIKSHLDSVQHKNRITVCGFLVHPFKNKEELLQYISDKRLILIALGAEKLLSRDMAFRKIVNHNIAYCDGVGAVLALRRKGLVVQKIPGASLWLDIINRFLDRGIYIIGSKQHILEGSLKRLKREFPGINILNARNGYFDDLEYKELKEDIRRLKPDIVFVAMGSPKQEYIMDELSQIHSALYMGLGGSLDLYSGAVKPVPEWWKKYFRWEGLYRQFYDIKNVKRWKRQVVVLGIIWKIVFNKV